MCYMLAMCLSTCYYVKPASIIHMFCYDMHFSLHPNETKCLYLLALITGTGSHFNCLPVTGTVNCLPVTGTVYYPSVTGNLLTVLL